MSEFERFADVPEDLQADLADWLLALADNKSLLGLRYAEWATGAPELEADVAIAAMAQYELGHARLLRGALGELAMDPRTEARDTDPAEWRSLPVLDHPAPSWTEVVVLNGLVDNLLTTNLAAAAAGGLAPLAQRLRKAVVEEHYHSLHAEAWFTRLTGGPANIIERLQTAVDGAWPQCLAWFGPDGDGALDRLAAAGIMDVGAAGLRDRFLEATHSLFAGPLSVAATRDEAGWTLGAEIDWSNWNEATRRHGVAHFDPESFAMITGAHARAMGVTD